MKRVIQLLTLLFFTWMQVSCSKDDPPVNPCTGVTVGVAGSTVNGTSGHSDGTLTVSATGGSGFTYSINGGAYQATGVFNNLAAGTYTVTAKNSSGCTGSSTPFTLTNHFIEFRALLNGASESTPNTSTATGNSILVFDSLTKIFTIATTHTVVSPTAAHIHKGAVGVAGGVVFGFTNLASPINYTSIALTTAQEADLKANLYYTNIHTATYGGGEIRGQLIRQ